MPKSRLLLLPLLAVLISGCESEHSAVEPTTHGVPEAESDATLPESRSLGTVEFPTSCDPAAQEHLERGLALLHHMTYVQAEPAFQKAAEIDPECAIAYWGVAMTYVHPLWPDVVSPEKLKVGRELLEKAMAASHISPRERSYVAALHAYYAGGPGRLESERLEGFLDGWTDVNEDHPPDPEAQLFYALALVATASPADKSYANRKEAGAIAEQVLARIPQHPGAHHYVIHAYDVPALAENALDVARSYGNVAPENSHALHMTSHIFTRGGLWPESIAFNERAADAASERTPAGEISLHHLHALDYLVYAYLQVADEEAVRKAMTRMEALEPPYQNHAATAYAFAAVPVRLALERQNWKAAMTVPARWPDGVPWDQYPHLVAIPVFAHALGAAHTGDAAAAQTAIDELSVLQEQAEALDMAYDWGIQVAIQRQGAEAWLAYTQGDTESGLKLMEQAAQMEASTEKNPVTPGEVLPARELYGDMLLDAGRNEAAREQYEAALARSPNRFNSLFGAGRAAELAGDTGAAGSYYRELLQIAPNPSGDEPWKLSHASKGRRLE